MSKLLSLTQALKIFFYMFCLFGFLLHIESQSGPAEIIIISHAEKDKNKDKEQAQDINLNSKGFSRAHALVPYFVNTELANGGSLPKDIVTHGESIFLMAKYGEPFALFAKGQKSSKNSVRAIQTLEPIAKALSLSINTIQISKEKFDIDNPAVYADLYLKYFINDIFDNIIYDQKRILICWRHGAIPSIIQAILTKENKDLRVPLALSNGSVFKKYDRIIRISYRNGRLEKIDNIPQALLAKDNKKSTLQTFMFDQAVIPVRNN